MNFTISMKNKLYNHYFQFWNIKENCGQKYGHKSKIIMQTDRNDSMFNFDFMESLDNEYNPEVLKKDQEKESTLFIDNSSTAYDDIWNYLNDNSAPFEDGLLVDNNCENLYKNTSLIENNEKTKINSQRNSDKFDDYRMDEFLDNVNELQSTVERKVSSTNHLSHQDAPLQNIPYSHNPLFENINPMNYQKNIHNPVIPNFYNSTKYVFDSSGYASKQSVCSNISGYQSTPGSFNRFSGYGSGMSIPNTCSGYTTGQSVNINNSGYGTGQYSRNNYSGFTSGQNISQINPGYGGNQNIDYNVSGYGSGQITGNIYDPRSYCNNSGYSSAQRCEINNPEYHNINNNVHYNNMINTATNINKYNQERYSTEKININQTNSNYTKEPIVNNSNNVSFSLNSVDGNIGDPRLSGSMAYCNNNNNQVLIQKIPNNIYNKQITPEKCYNFNEKDSGMSTSSRIKRKYLQTDIDEDMVNMEESKTFENTKKRRIINISECSESEKQIKKLSRNVKDVKNRKIKNTSKFFFEISEEQKNLIKKIKMNNTYGRGNVKLEMWQFILFLLEQKDAKKFDMGVSWLNRAEGTIIINNTKKLAELWGIYQGNEFMTYESMSRNLRHYYSGGKCMLVKSDVRKAYTYHPECMEWCKELERCN